MAEYKVMKEVKDYNPSKDPRLIDCKTECGNERCYARRYGLFAEKTCPNFVEPKPITNADRIRAMSDEALAEWLTNFSSSNVKPYATARVEMYRGSLLDWLRQEAKDEQAD